MIYKHCSRCGGCNGEWELTFQIQKLVFSSLVLIETALLLDLQHLLVSLFLLLNF